MRALEFKFCQMEKFIFIMDEKAMKIKCFSVLLASCLTTGAQAMICPKVVTGLTFQHSYVAPPNLPQPWYMDPGYEAKGWYVERSPVLDNVKATTIQSSGPMAVLLTVDRSGFFYATCAYQIETDDIPVILNVRSSIGYSAPTNPNFKKVGETQYVCATEADRPDDCSDFEVKPRPIIFGRS